MGEEDREKKRGGEAVGSRNREREREREGGRERGRERERERARRADATTTGVGNFRDRARFGKLSQ